MFSLQGNDDLLIQILSKPCQQSKISQDPVMDYASLETTTRTHPPNINSQKKRVPKRKIGTTNNDETVSDDHFKLRRIIHRDIERQRRQEMSALYTSLRSLLPLQYIKGKRAVSDHMHEAVNYIKEMQSNIKELEKQRDLLIRSSSPAPLPNSSGHGTENGSTNSFTDCTITVSPCLQGGIQISISIDCKGNSFHLSRVLRELLKQRLNVVSCVSAKANQRSLYTIQTEACDKNNIDHVALQQKVIDMINLDL